MKTISKILLIAIAIVFYSCDDILEEDITDDVIQTSYPQNNQQITSNVVNFQWNKLKGADDYRVQVFAANQNIVLDSLVSQNNFTATLAAGNYQWRVRGENFAYTSAYSYSANFTMIESDDLGQQQVILSNPSNNFYTNSSNITLSWENLNAADTYTFQLINVTNGQSVISTQPNLTVNSVNLDNTLLNADAQYQWKVQAFNSTSNTQFASRTFSVDKTSPTQPLNSLPVANTTQLINQEISFGWSVPTDAGAVQSPLSYTIEFSNTIAFSSIILQQSGMAANAYQHTFTAAGDYYWRVRAKDQAGNIGTNSNYFKFTIE